MGEVYAVGRLIGDNGCGALANDWGELNAYLLGVFY
jgi:hypothetical protein